LADIAPKDLLDLRLATRRDFGGCDRHTLVERVVHPRKIPLHFAGFRKAIADADLGDAGPTIAEDVLREGGCGDDQR
jgi:hypothetical protein